MGQNRSSLRASWHLITLAILITTLLPALAAPAAAAPANRAAPRAALATTSTVHLNVISARTEPRAFGGAGVRRAPRLPPTSTSSTSTTPAPPSSAWIRTRGPAAACTPADPGYPDSCDWVSIAGAPGSSPIYTQGDQSDFAGGPEPAGRALPDLRAGRRLQAGRRPLHGAARWPGWSQSSYSPPRCPRRPCAPGSSRISRPPTARRMRPPSTAWPASGPHRRLPRRSDHGMSTATHSARGTMGEDPDTFAIPAGSWTLTAAGAQSGLPVRPVLQQVPGHGGQVRPTVPVHTDCKWACWPSRT